MNQINGLPQGKMEVSRFEDHQKSSHHLSQVMLTNRVTVAGPEKSRKRISQEKGCLCWSLNLELEKGQRGKARRAGRGGRPKGNFGSSFPTGLADIDVDELVRTESQ